MANDVRFTSRPGQPVSPAVNESKKLPSSRSGFSTDNFFLTTPNGSISPSYLSADIDLELAERQNRESSKWAEHMRSAIRHLNDALDSARTAQNPDPHLENAAKALALSDLELKRELFKFAYGIGGSDRGFLDPPARQVRTTEEYLSLFKASSDFGRVVFELSLKPEESTKAGSLFHLGLKALYQTFFPEARHDIKRILQDIDPSTLS